MKILDYNIYSPKPSDIRSNNVLQTIRKKNPDVICLQEVTPTWMKILQADLSDCYGMAGEAREEGKDAEYNPVLYKKEDYTLCRQKTFWLSDTPAVISRVPESMYYRICTMTVLQEQTTGKRIRVVCLHMDYVQAAAARQAEILLRLLRAEEQLPTVFCGDLNTMKWNDAYKILANSEYTDAENAAEQKSVAPTFQKFGERADTIDFCFVKDVKVKNFVVEEVKINGEYPSDHNPVCMEVEFGGK